MERSTFCNGCALLRRQCYSLLLYVLCLVLSSNSLIHTQPDLKPKQSELEETLLKVISGTEGYPTPGRAIRRVVGRCFTVLYTRGETRTMFDTLQALVKLVGDPKLDKEAVKMYVASNIQSRLN